MFLNARIRRSWRGTERHRHAADRAPLPGLCGKSAVRGGNAQPGRAGGQRHGGLRAAGPAHQVHRRGRRRRARAASRWKACSAPASTSTTCRCGATAPTSRRTSLSTAPPASARCCGAATIACASTRSRSRRSRSPARACCTSTGTTRRRWRTPRPWRGRHGIPVTVDVDTIYHGFDRVLPNVDYLVASSEFPAPGRAERSVPGARNDPERVRHAGGGHDAGGARGAGARGGQFYYSPAFVVNCVDTTGAGDVFHGAFCYAVLQGMPMRRALWIFPTRWRR